LRKTLQPIHQEDVHDEAAVLPAVNGAVNHVEVEGDAAADQDQVNVVTFREATQSSLSKHT